MPDFITTQAEIPKAPYYVVMDDPFFSGWGPSEGKTSTYIYPCANYAEAEVVAENAKARKDQKRVRINVGKPKLSRGHLYQLKTRADGPSWYVPGYFAKQVAEEKARRRAGGKARHAGSGKLERSLLRPFATYCAGCHAHLGGKEHAWRVKGTEQYLCDACGGGTGGGKKRHGGKWYVGTAFSKGRMFEPFRAARKPTQSSHGKKYGYAIGPFRSKGGAAVMARYGAGNPNLVTVSQAEKMAKREKAAGNLDKLIAEVDAMMK